MVGKSARIFKSILLMTCPFFLISAWAMTCPDCKEDTFNGINCTNRNCPSNQARALGTSSNQVNTILDDLLLAQAIENLRQTEGGDFDIPYEFYYAPQQDDTPSADNSGINSAPGIQQPEWIRTLSQHTTSGQEGEMPQLVFTYKNALKKDSGYTRLVKDKGMRWATFISDALEVKNRQLLVRFTFAYKGQKFATHLAIEINEYGHIFVLSDTEDIWNQVTIVSVGEVLTFLLTDFDPDTDSLEFLTIDHRKTKTKKAQAWCSDIDEPGDPSRDPQNYKVVQGDDPEDGLDDPPSDPEDDELKPVPE